MLFYPEHRRFKTRCRIFQKSLQIILLSGVLLSGLSSHCFNAELGAQYDSTHAQTRSRFAFAPRGFEAYLTKLTEDRQLFLTRVSVEAPLTGSPPGPITANLIIATPQASARGDNGEPIRVRIINRALSGYSKAPADIFSNGGNIPESKRPSDVVKAARVQEVEPHSATSSWIVNEPSETALTAIVNSGQEIGKARLRPKVAKSRRVSVRSPRRRARAKRPSISVGQPLFSDMPEWARKALFKSGG